MSTKLLIIRHGQIRANRAGRWHGATDSPLTAAGQRQAVRVARLLQQECKTLDAIYCSPLRRCYHTALSIADVVGQEVVAEDDLREYTIGEFENLTFKSLHQDHDFFERILKDPDFAPAGGESINGVATRTVTALNRIALAHQDAAHVAVVSHGAAMAIALARVLDDDITKWTNYHIANCSITELVLKPEPLMGAFNRIEHL